MNETNLELSQKESVNLVHFVNRLVRAGTNKIGASKVDSDFYAFQKSALDAIIGKIDIATPESVLVIDDAGLQIIQRLVNVGVKNITLAITRLDKDSLIDLSYIIKKRLTKYNWDINLDIRHFEEVMGMNFDLVIANPPYKAIGAKITKKIIDSIAFKQYINLLPANDYKRVDGLWNYQYDMVSANSITGEYAFEDASVTTHIAKISKAKVNTLTEQEFERSTYIDKSLDKYFKENAARSHYAIDEMPFCGKTIKNAGIWDVNTTFIIGHRDMNHKSMPRKKDSLTYLWNVEESIDFNYILENHNTRDNRFMISECQFLTSKEKRNFVKFVYAGNEAKFIQKIFTALNCDGGTRSIAFPKVDWTHSWTVEEILKDYGYTDSEIKEVMDDLPNFKGMDD